MTQQQIEKLLKRIAATNEMMAIAQTAMADTNAMIVDVVLRMNTRTESDNDTPPTMQ
jgi:hypothetical protein